MPGKCQRLDFRWLQHGRRLRYFFLTFFKHISKIIFSTFGNHPWIHFLEIHNFSRITSRVSQARFYIIFESKKAVRFVFQFFQSTFTYFFLHLEIIQGFIVPKIIKFDKKWRITWKVSGARFLIILEFFFANKCFCSPPDAQLKENEMHMRTSR